LHCSPRICCNRALQQLLTRLAGKAACIEGVSRKGVQTHIMRYCTSRVSHAANGNTTENIMAATLKWRHNLLLTLCNYLKQTYKHLMQQRTHQLSINSLTASNPHCSCAVDHQQYPHNYADKHNSRASADPCGRVVGCAAVHARQSMWNGDYIKTQQQTTHMC
jgi:hypothetical protein